MSSFNRVILLGNIARDPAIRYSQDSLPVVCSALAINRKYKSNNEVVFIDFVVFGKLAETMNTYAQKGTQVLIEGRLSQNTWEQDGQKRSKHEIIVESFQLISGGKDNNSRGGANDPYGRKNERSNSTDICPDCGKPRDLCVCEIPF